MLGTKSTVIGQSAASIIISTKPWKFTHVIKVLAEKQLRLRARILSVRNLKRPLAEVHASICFSRNSQNNFWEKVSESLAH